MKHQLAITLMGILFTLDAYALGLSHIEVYSKLNEPLNAKIDILSIPQGNIGNIKVSLATAESFRRAGLDRPHLLTAMQFNVQAAGKTAAVIKLATQQPIREPFLNFLVEVTWPSGRILREYTVLLDPPLYEKKLQMVTSSPPTKSTKSASRATTPGTPTRGSSPPPTAEKSKPTKKPVTRATTRGRRPATAGGEGSTYTVSKNETLWQIANRTRPKSTSLQQHMVNIFYANPDAFLKRNMNLIKAGKVVRVPGWGGGPTSPPPMAEVAELQPKKPTVKDTAPAPESAPPESELKKALGKTPAEPQVRITSPTETSDKPAGTGAGASNSPGNEELKKLKKDLTQLTEKNATVTEENKGLKDELSKTKAFMKEQMDKVNNLLKLQSQEFAKLQDQLNKQTELLNKQTEELAQARQELAEAKKSATARPPLPPTDNKVADSSPQPKPKPGDTVHPPKDGKLAPGSGEKVPSQENENIKTPPPSPGAGSGEKVPSQGDENIKTPPPSPGAGSGEKVPSQGDENIKTPAVTEEPKKEPDNATVATTEGTKTTPVTKLSPSSPVDKTGGTQPGAEKSIMDTANELVNQVPGGWLTVGGVGGGAMMLFFVGGFLRRQRKGEGIAEWQEGTEVAEEDLQAELARLEEVEVLPNPPKPDEPLPYPEPMPEPDIDDVDLELLENVDVYIAYESFDKAEDLLKPAIEQHPNTPKYRLKLLEVYAAAKELDKFDTEAQELHDSVAGQGPLWDEALNLWEGLSTGRDLNISTHRVAAEKPDTEGDALLAAVAGLTGAAVVGGVGAMALAGDETGEALTEIDTGLETFTDTDTMPGSDEVLSGLDSVGMEDLGLDLGTLDDGLDLGIPAAGHGEEEQSLDLDDLDLGLGGGEDAEAEMTAISEEDQDEISSEEPAGLALEDDLDLGLDSGEEATEELAPTEENLSEDLSLEDGLTFEEDSGVESAEMDLTASPEEDLSLDMDLGEEAEAEIATSAEEDLSHVEDLSLDMGEDAEAALVEEDLSLDEGLSLDMGEDTEMAISEESSIDDDDLGAEAEAVPVEDELSLDDDLSLDLGAEAAAVPAEDEMSFEDDLSLDLGAEAEAVPTKEEMSIDDELSLDMGTEAEVATPTEDEMSLDDDLSLDMGEDTEVVEPAEEEEMSLDEDLLEDSSLDMGEDTEGEDTEMAAPATEEEELSLDEDLSLDMDDEDTEVVAPAEEDMSIDEDLSLDMDEDTEVVAPAEEDMSIDEDLSLDMDNSATDEATAFTDTEELSLEMEEHEDHNADDSLSSLDDGHMDALEEIASGDDGLDLKSLGLDDDLAGELGMQLDDHDTANGSDNLDDLLSQLGGGEMGEQTDDLSLDSSLDSSDDISSKFDLVQMYIDLEDNDNARTVLEEIIAEGNDEQKRKAQKLMKKIA